MQIARDPRTLLVCRTGHEFLHQVHVLDTGRGDDRHLRQKTDIGLVEVPAFLGQKEPARYAVTLHVGDRDKGKRVEQCGQRATLLSENLLDDALMLVLGL